MCFYIFPCRKIENNSQKAINPTTKKPIIPITGISCHLGGIPERTIRAEPITREARTI